MIGASTETVLCQVRSATEQPCGRPADREILGVPFCEACAREHEAYAVVGELVEAQDILCEWTARARSLRNAVLAGMLDRMQLELAMRLAGARRALRETGELERAR